MQEVGGRGHGKAGVWEPDPRVTGPKSRKAWNRNF